jgi:hypothetical protein
MDAGQASVGQRADRGVRARRAEGALRLGVGAVGGVEWAAGAAGS